MSLSEADLISEAGRNQVWKTVPDYEEFKDLVGKQNFPKNKAESILNESVSNSTSTSMKETADGSAVYIKLPYPTSNIQVKKVAVAKLNEASPKPKSENSEAAVRLPQQQRKSKMVEIQNEQSLKKYVRSIDDIKEEYSSWLKRQTITKRRVVSKPLVVAGLVLVISAVSFLAWQSFGSKEVNAEPGTSYTASVEPVLNQNSSAETSEASEVEKTGNNEIAPIHTSSSQKPNVVVGKHLPTKNEQKPTPNTAKEEVHERVVSEPAIEKPEIKIETASMPSTTATEVSKVEKEAPKPAPLEKLVDVKGNYVSSGKKGISNFNITINNRSNELLKLVAVDVFYYDQSKKMINKKTVYINNLAGGDKTSVNASPDSNAVSAGWQIGLISSAEGAIHYAKQ